MSHIYPYYITGVIYNIIYINNTYYLSDQTHAPLTYISTRLV